MYEMEKMIWAAAYAAFLQGDVRFHEEHGKPRMYSTLESMGFAAAEWADEAVFAFREAINGGDGPELIPLKEGWIDLEDDLEDTKSSGGCRRM